MANVLERKDGRPVVDLTRPRGRSLAGNREEQDRNIFFWKHACDSDHVWKADVVRRKIASRVNTVLSIRLA